MKANLIARLLGHRRLFGLWERLGIHVTPVHFYQPIPDTRKLDDSLWSGALESPGVLLDRGRMIELLDRLAGKFAGEWQDWLNAGEDKPSGYKLDNRRFGAVDAEVLYGMIREFQPQRVIEIGSGWSTRLIMEALNRNNNHSSTKPSKLLTIDPFPCKSLDGEMNNGFQLIDAEVQSLDLSLFESLVKNDILFIDSTHVVRIGSDVIYEVLKILPVLKPGVLVHFHDIFIPSEYPREWIFQERVFWTEQYLLQAFLAFNACYEVVWAGHFIHKSAPEELEARIPSYRPGSTVPGSFWIRRSM